MHRLTEERLEYATNGAGPVAVAFSADWCSSSLDLVAALEQVGEALGDDRLTTGWSTLIESPALRPHTVSADYRPPCCSRMAPSSRPEQAG